MVNPFTGGVQVAFRAELRDREPDTASSGGGGVIHYARVRQAAKPIFMARGIRPRQDQVSTIPSVEPLTAARPPCGSAR